MDDSKLKKPEHVKDHIWRQHLQWREVMVKQVEENIKQRQKQVDQDTPSRRQE